VDHLCGDRFITEMIATDVVELLLGPLWAAVVVFLALGVAWLLRRPIKRALSDLA
jgi:hypothetical protein